MDLQRQDYPAMLTSLPPPAAVRVLQDRLQHVARLNTEIADWLQERKRIEATYAQSLRKLAARQLLDGPAELGIFSQPWQKIIASVDDLASSHHSLAASIENDVERPIRDFNSSNREMKGMSNMLGNIQAMAKELEKAEQKAAKLQEKGGRADVDKVASTANEVENAQGQWESQAPFVFERLQELDEQRLENLRNALTQYTTYAIESQNAGTTTAEECLNALLNVQTIDEIKTFAMKSATNPPRTSRIEAPGSRAGPPSRAGADASAFIPPESGPALAPTISLNRPGPDGGAGRTNSFQEKEKPEKSKLSGLKRLGTVLGRRRQSTQPQSLGSERPELERKKSGSNLNASFNPLRNRSKNQRLSEIPAGADERRMSEQSFEPPPSSSGQTPQLERQVSERTIERTNGHDTIEEAPPQLAPIANGSSSAFSSSFMEPLEPIRPTQQQPPRIDDQGFSAPPSGLDAISQAEREAAEAGEGPSTNFRVDIRNEAIAEEGDDATAAMTSMANTLRAQAGPPRRSMGTVRGRRDRNTMLMSGSDEQLGSIARTESPVTSPLANSESRSIFPDAAPLAASTSTSIFPEPAPLAASTSSSIFPEPTVSKSAAFPEPAPLKTQSLPIAPIQESQDEISEFSPPPTASTFSATSPTSQQSATSPVAFTTPAPPLPSMPIAAPLDIQRASTPPAQHSPFKMSTRSAMGIDEHGGSDTHSIRSGRSLSSTGSNAVRHPELHGPGLNTSIVETVSAWFTDSTITRAVVVGELALAYNPSDVSTPFGTDTIRLDNFGSLEKVAPNPAFIEPLTVNGDFSGARTHPGSYNVTLRDIVSKTVVAFKYQLRVEPSELDQHCPLRMHASWKIEDTQASVVLQYSLAPGFAATLPAGTSSVHLENVVLLLNIDQSGAKASNAKAMGGGIFSRERGLVYWRLGDITLARDAPANTLRARFFTEGPAKAGSVEARWECTVPTSTGQNGLSVSVLDRSSTAQEEHDPFADEEAPAAAPQEGSWSVVSAVKKLRSGTYVSGAAA